MLTRHDGLDHSFACPRTRPGIRGSALLLTLMIAAAPRPALAGTADEATAQVLFEDGKKALADKDFELACRKLEKSQQLAPANGTLLFLAICRENQGKTATAWVLFHEVVSVARTKGRADREKVALEHIADLTPKLIKVSVNVPTPSRDEEIRIDGAPVARAAWGTSFPMDPGLHVLEARAPSKTVHRVTFPLSSDLVLTVPLLGSSAAVIAPPAAPSHGPLDEPSRTRERAGLVMMGAGVIGLAVGTTFGIRSLVKRSDADEACRLGTNQSQCNPSGIDADSAATNAGVASTVGFIAGGVLVASGLVLWLTAPRAASNLAISVRVTPGAAALGGSF